MRLRRWFLKAIEPLLPERKLMVIEGDSLPVQLPWRSLVLAREDDEDWCVGLRCPCGCGYRIELPVIQEASPRWSLSIDSKGSPTVHPSVWLKKGCCSHFWIKSGRVRWCS